MEPVNTFSNMNGVDDMERSTLVNPHGTSGLAVGGPIGIYGSNGITHDDLVCVVGMGKSIFSFHD